jgi:uncharacterized membrane protein YeaQ/YmgE (transglycosylase-associated protein family)
MERGETVMTLESLLIILLVAGICGAIGQAISGSWTGGVAGALVIGFLGWLIGTWLAVQLGMGEPLPLNISGWTFPVLWTVIGSTLIGLLARLFMGRGHVVLRRYPDY